MPWKQRPLRPQNLKTKTPYFWGLQNYDEPVVNATESWALVTRILRLLLASWTGIRGIGFVLNRNTLCFVSSKKLTICLFEVFNFCRKYFQSKMKVWLQTITVNFPQNSYNPRNVIDIFSAARFSAVSTIVGAWQKQAKCFAWFLEGFVLTACKKKMFCEVSKQRRFLTKTPSQTHDILVPLHVESDSCDRSGVGIKKKKKSSWKTSRFEFRCEGKILLKLFGEDVFHLATLKNISVVSWHLPKKRPRVALSVLKYCVVEIEFLSNR